MAYEQVEQFFDQVKSDASLRENLNKVSEDAQRAAREGIVNLAAEAGFTFSSGDLDSYYQAQIEKAKESGELSEEQLEAVTGAGAYQWAMASALTLGVACLISLKARPHCGLDV